MSETTTHTNIPQDVLPGFELLPTGAQQVLSRFYEKQALAMKDPRTIEIAGKKILAMPLESMTLTPEQKKKFEETGGLMNPSPKVATADKNQDKMMYWAESFEMIQAEIDGTLYKGFDLFKKTYEAFPDIRSMTKEEATEAGLYPTIHYRNFAARKWMAEMNGGHLATLDKDYNGELRDIYNAAEGKTNLQKLVAMGQVLIGGCEIGGKVVYFAGNLVRLGSGSLDKDGCVRVLSASRNEAFVDFSWDFQDVAISSVVVIDN